MSNLIRSVLRAVALFFCPALKSEAENRERRLKEYSELCDRAIAEAKAQREVAKKIEYSFLSLPTKENEPEYFSAMAGFGRSGWVKAWFLLQREALVRQMVDKGTTETYARYHGALIWLDQMKIDLEAMVLRGANK